MVESNAASTRRGQASARLLRWICALCVVATFASGILWFIYTIMPFFRSESPDWMLSISLTFLTILLGAIVFLATGRLQKSL